MERERKLVYDTKETKYFLRLCLIKTNPHQSQNFIFTEPKFLLYRKGIVHRSVEHLAFPTLPALLQAPAESMLLSEICKGVTWVSSETKAWVHAELRGKCQNQRLKCFKMI